MRYRTIGHSDLKVSEIALGSRMDLTDLSDLDTIRGVTDAAFDVGINFFDTSNSYGRGLAETAWGHILRRHPRGSYILATKVFRPMSDDPTDQGLSWEQIHKQLDASLRRLQTDYLDLYQAHRFDPDTPIEETVEAFQDVVASGKVRYLGFSEWTPQQIQASIDIAGPDLFVSSQPQYSLLWQAPEAEVFPLCDQHRISQIVWSPLAMGVLTGKYRAGQDPPADSRAATSWLAPLMHELVLNDQTLAAVDRLRPIVDDLELSMVQLALAWVLRRNDIAAAIIGASRPEQVRANANAAGIHLTNDTLAAIDQALGDVPVTTPQLASHAHPGITYRH